MEIPTMMKALIKDNPSEGMTYKEIPVPVPGPGEVLLKIILTSLCGSDISLYKWNKIATSIAELPFTPGHETVGEIVRLGAGVPDRFKLGSRVTVENHLFCGACYQCTHDQKHICANMKQYGHGKGTKEGGCAQYSTVHHSYLYLLQHDITDKQACLLEPAGVAHQALEEVDPAGEVVLVFGCGPIGLMACSIAKCLKASKVIATDVRLERLEKSLEMDADVTVDAKSEDFIEKIFKLTDEVGVGVVVEASGNHKVPNLAFELIRKGGKIVVIGIMKESLNIHIENPVPNFVQKSITLKTVHGRKIFRSWEESERLVAEQLLQPEKIISHLLPMSRFDDCYKLLISGECLKIVIDPQN